MFVFAIIIGVYSYAIFFLGLLHQLYLLPVMIVTILCCLSLAIFYFTKRKQFSFTKQSTFFYALLFILCCQASINLIGALGPELSFDALWYHLTLPKLYVLHHAIYHIPGGLLIYSDLPKLTEMYYTAALLFSNEIAAKLIHFSFGVLSCIALYFFSKKYLLSTYSVLVVLIFYSNLVMGFESITAFSDLPWTFFSILSIWTLFEWNEKQNNKHFIYSAIFCGFAITAKLVAISNLIIMLLILFIIQKKKNRIKITTTLAYFAISLLIPLPWFVFSYINTHNPVYPFFTPIFSSLENSTIRLSTLNPLSVTSSIIQLFSRSADPISPLYLIFIPLIIICYNKFDRSTRWMLLYVALSLFLWYITPQTGGARFFMPYLPVFSLLCGYCLSKISIHVLHKPFVAVIILVCMINLCYRGVANAKFVPVLLGRESKNMFLTNHLNFSFGDFYDTDGYFKKHIITSDTVLLYGFHNLYYIDFPFIDSSWLTKHDTYNYIAVQNGLLPKQFVGWKKTYINTKTHVALYTKI